jgi:hypothetical protein
MFMSQWKSERKYWAQKSQYAYKGAITSVAVFSTPGRYGCIITIKILGNHMYKAISEI